MKSVKAAMLAGILAVCALFSGCSQAQQVESSEGKSAMKSVKTAMLAGFLAVCALFSGCSQAQQAEDRREKAQ